MAENRASGGIVIATEMTPAITARLANRRHAEKLTPLLDFSVDHASDVVEQRDPSGDSCSLPLPKPKLFKHSNGPDGVLGARLHVVEQPADFMVLVRSGGQH
jgi:hypothetical protein